MGRCLVKRFVCIAWFHTHQNSSLSLSSSLLVPHNIIPIPESETLVKKKFDSVSRNSQRNRNSQQNGASTRLTLQSHKAKGNQATIQIFSEFDFLHEMGVNAVFWSSWAPIPRFYCLRSLPQPRIPVQLAVSWRRCWKLWWCIRCDWAGCTCICCGCLSC